MNHLPPDFTETFYHGWDTIGDIFHHPFVVEAIRECRNVFNFDPNMTEGDILHTVFREDDKIETFLQFLRHDIETLEDTQKIIVLILSIRYIKEQIQESTQTVIGIFSQRVSELIQQAKGIEYGHEDSSQDEVLTFYQGLDILISNNGFVPITTEGEVVYYHSQTDPDTDPDHTTINVWGETTGVMTINKDGEILSERDDSFEEPKGKKSLTVLDGEGNTEKVTRKADETVGVIHQPKRGENIVTHERFTRPAKKKRTKKKTPPRTQDQDTGTEEN